MDEVRMQSSLMMTTTREEKIPDHQSSPAPWGRRCPGFKASSKFVTILFVAMSVFVACVTMIHLLVQTLTLPLEVEYEPSNPNPFQSPRFIARRGTTLIERIVHGSTRIGCTAQQLRRPWNDPNWVSKVKQSGTPKKAGDFSVLVTGAAGFLGSYASVAMKKKGWGVVGLDHFYHDYFDPALKREREAHVYKKGRNFIVDGDINDEILLKELFRIVPFTHVLHLAAQTGHGFRFKPGHRPPAAAARNESPPLSYVSSNVAGLVTLLEVCAKGSNSTSTSNHLQQQHRQPAIVWASSSSVYGLNGHVPSSEFDRTDRPKSMYAATKKAGEEIVHVYNHLYGLSVTVLRMFDVYGPWSRPDMHVFRFTKAILDEKPITIYEQEAHDLSYVDDIISGCIAAVLTADKSVGFGPQKKGPQQQRAQLRVFNMGAGVPTRMTDVIRILESLLDKKVTRVIQLQEKTTHQQPQHGLGHRYAVANLSLARTQLGYAPRTNLLDGLKKFVAWYYHRHAKAHII